MPSAARIHPSTLYLLSPVSQCSWVLNVNIEPTKMAMRMGVIMAVVYQNAGAWQSFLGAGAILGGGGGFFYLSKGHVP